MFDYQTMIQYFNIGIIVMIAGGAIAGFLRGLFKSVYNFVVFVALLLLGWFLSPVFVRMLMDFDLSSIYQFRIQDVTITSINETLPLLASSFVPGLTITADSMAFELAHAIVFMALRLVVIIVWLILMFTVFKFLTWIIYLIIKPKKRKGVKKSLVSRLSGMAIGVLHTLIIIVLFSIPLSGLTSMGSSLLAALPDDQQPISYRLVYEEDGPVLQYLAENPLSQFEDIFKFMDEYRNTVSGQISGFIKIEDQYLDEYIFGDILSFEYHGTKVRLNEEIIIGVRVYSILMENIEGELNLENVLALDDEILVSVLADIASLKILQVAIPVGVEYAYNQGLLDMLTEEQYEEVLAGLVEIDFGEEISNIGSAFIKAGRLGLFDFDQSFQYYLSLDGDDVKDVFTDLGKLELIDLLGNIGISYLLGSEFLTELDISPYDIDLTDIVWSDEIENLGNVVKALIELGLEFDEEDKIKLDALTDQGINAFSAAVFGSRLLSNNSATLARVLVTQLPDEYRDFLTINDIAQSDFTSLLILAKVLYDSGIFEDELQIELLLTEENIERIAQAISSSQLLSSNIANLIKTLLADVDLPFEISDASLNRNWSGASGKAELIALFTAAEKIFDMNISDDDFIKNLTGDQINELADTLAESTVLMMNIGNLIDYLIEELNKNGEITISTEPVADMDWTSEAGKNEFKSILHAFSAIIDAGLLQEDPALDQIADGTVDTNDDGVVDENDEDLIAELAKSMSASILIRHNLSNIIEQVLSKQSQDLSIEVFEDPNQWTELEIDSLFRAAKIIMGKEKLPEDLFSLTDAELDTIFNSVLISRTIVNTIKDFTAEDGSLHDLLIIDNVSETAWYDRYEEEVRIDGELRKLIASAKTLLGENPDFSDSENLISLNRIQDLTDAEINQLVASIILRDSIANQLIKFGNDPDSPLVVHMTLSDLGWEEEIKALIRAIEILLGEDVDVDNIQIDANEIKNLTTGLDDEEDDELGEILKSRILTDTIISTIIDLGKPAEGGTPLVVNLTADDPRWFDQGDNPGEIRILVRAIQRILSPEDDLNSPDVITLDKIRALTEDDIDLLANSYIIVDTAVNSLESMTSPASGGDPAGSLHEVIYLPEGITYFGSNGEFKHFFLALKLLLDENLEEGQNIEDLDTIKLTSLTNPLNQEKILRSKIIIETIVVNVEKEAAKPDAVIRIAPELNRSDPDYVPGTWDTEIPKLLDAILVIIGDEADLKNISFDEDRLLNLHADEIDTLVRSRVIAYTAVKNIEEERENAGSFITLPDDLNPDHPSYNESLWYSTDEVEGELAKALKALAKLGLANMESNIDFQPLFDEVNGVEDEVILASRVVEATIINKIITEAEEGGQLAGRLIIPADINWYKTPEDQGELRRFLKAMAVVIGDGDFDTAEFDVKKFFGPDQETLLGSRIVEESIINEIQKEADEGGSLEGRLVIPADINWYKTEEDEGELRRFLAAIEVIIGEGDFENADFDVKEFFGPNQETLLGSRIVEASIINEIEKEAGAGGSLEGRLVIPADINWYKTSEDEGELRRFLAAIEVIIGEDDFETAEFDVKKFFGPDQETLLGSRIVEASIINEIEKEAGAGGSLEGRLVIPADINWYKTPEDEGELRRFLTAIEIIIDGEFENTTFNVKDFFGEDQETLLASRIIEASIINEIEKEAATGGSLEGRLVIPADINWYKTPEDEGELRRFLAAIEVIIGEGDFENTEFNVKDFFGEDQETLLASRIIEASIINEIESEAAPGGSLAGRLIIPADINWYKTEEDEGELRRFLTAIEIIIGEGDFENTEFNVKDFFGEDQETLLASRIIEESIINEITTEASPGHSLYNKLIIPVGVNWYKTSNDEGELRRFLTAIEIIIGEGDFENTTFNVKDFFGGDQETLLASRIIEESIINEITTEAAPGGSLNGTLIIPADINWYKTEEDNGELRRFLTAIEIIIGEGEFENTTFNVKDFFGEDQETLLASRIIEESIINEIETEAAPGGSLAGKLVIPADVNWYKTPEDNGELRKFLSAIDIILGDDDFEDAVFRVDHFLGDNRENLLASKIIEASAIKYVKEAGSLIIPDPSNPDFYYFSDEELVWEKTETDEGELRRFLTGIKILMGTESGFDSFVFDMDVMLDTDFEVVLQSRVLEATLADMVNDLIDGGVLNGMIKEPDGGYQWYHHATSAHADPVIQSVRNGEFLINGNYQYSDLSGFLKAIQAMNNAGLHFEGIDRYAIAATDSIALATALCDYSRVIGGSIATMLNYVLKDIFPGGVFTDEDLNYQNKASIISGLNTFKLLVTMYG